jgi:glutathione-regulated potassium-efflux system ancillary protein KefG
MARILILFAHPALERSRVHRRLVERVPRRDGLTFHDLYELYPDFAVNVRREQELLVAHDLVLLQHPFYWYGTPALLKQWQDLVLEHGWAYGSTGTALAGKRLANVVSTGGAASAYTRDGFNRHTVRELLAPIEQTARLCGMEYLPPYLVQGTHRMTDADIDRAARAYGDALDALLDGRVDLSAWSSAPSLDALLAGVPDGSVA